MKMNQSVKRGEGVIKRRFWTKWLLLLLWDLPEILPECGRTKYGKDYLQTQVKENWASAG